MLRSRLFYSAALALFLTPASLTLAHAEESETRLDPYYGRISPFYGRISPFEGDIDPFWGRISPFEDGSVEPFWGRISPFEGDIDSFWGRLSPFEGDDVEPFWGRISPFWGRISPFMGDLQANWGRISPFDDTNPGDHQALIDQIQYLIDESKAFWSDQILAQTGQTFEEAFLEDLLAEFGIDLGDPSSLDNFTDADRAAFQFAWYDGLMAFSGQDHVDHWMETANWSPSLTQIQGMGADTVIGLIDFALTKDEDLLDNVFYFDGDRDPAGGHGGAVASLLVADHDGEGLMGIAPQAQVAMYNPFDADGTASWDSVAFGIQTVTRAGASIVNLSLGVSGATFDEEWADLYQRPGIVDVLDNTIFVHAAGNDGVAQSEDLAWGVKYEPHLIIVGSVGPSGQISAFSNTPGDACFLNSKGKKCDSYLRDRFIVAPGEWILVTDGAGGVTRASGTSFAAPIVTGAIALLHDRWSWLTEYPEETVNIIFETADDLGAPGVDDVYGHGLLNITASQSPLDFDQLYQIGEDKHGRATKNYLSGYKKNHYGDYLGSDEGYIVVLEDVGATYRDFLIPISELLNDTGITIDGSREFLQDYVSEALANSGQSGTGTKGKKIKENGNNGNGNSKKKNKVNVLGTTLAMQAFPLTADQALRDDRLPYATEFELQGENGLTFAFGNGVGAMSLTGDASANHTRFQRRTGGVNPVLGFASGGAFSRVDLPVFGSGTLSIGVSEREYKEEYIDPMTGEIVAIYPDLDAFNATATHITFAQPITDAFDVSVGFTRLVEDNSALGVQSLMSGGFAAGAYTNAVSVDAEWALSPHIALSGSYTRGQTFGGDSNDTLTLGASGINTEAFEVAANLSDMFVDSDHLRLALVQPLRITSGRFETNGFEVIDRSTGALGRVTRDFAIDESHSLALETTWSAPLTDAMSVSGFLRLEETYGLNAAEANQLGGASVTIRF